MPIPSSALSPLRLRAPEHGRQGEGVDQEQLGEGAQGAGVFRFVEFKIGDDWCSPWQPCTWSDFARDNPDDAPRVAADIAVYGISRIGGGAAPPVTIRHGSAPSQMAGDALQ